MVNSSKPKWSANILCIARTSFTHPFRACLIAAAAAAAEGSVEGRCYVRNQVVRGVGVLPGPSIISYRQLAGRMKLICEHV
jgi:hypothetical protein